MAQHNELRCLCDYLGGAQAINTWQRPAPRAVGGELERDERGEVVFAEIWSPVTPAGVEEELRRVIIILDGDECKYVSLSGIQATNMAPPKPRIFQGHLYSFGSPHNNNPLFSTTLKYKSSVSVGTLAGAAIAITQPFRVRLWGYIYKESEIPGVFGSMQFPAQLIDRARGRVLRLDKAPIPVNGASWLTIPGGKDQSIPKINPFVRYAYNLLATDGLGGDYQVRWDTGAVVAEWENMWFDFDEKDALLIESLGAKAGVNMARTGLRIDGDYHPKGMTTALSLFPTDLAINELNYGHLFPFAPLAHPYFAAIPKLDRPFLIWNEIGGVVIRDDTVGVVAANAAQLALTGIRIEMRS